MTTAHGVVQTPAFMPVGTRGRRQGRHAAGPGRGRGRDHPRQHLSPVAAARRPADRQARRPAPLHRLGPAHPHRQRRLPGVQPRRAARDLRGGHPVPVAPGRQRAHAHARGGDRHPVAPRAGHRHGARRVPGPAGRPSRPSASPPSGRPAGPAAAASGSWRHGDGKGARPHFRQALRKWCLAPFRRTSPTPGRRSSASSRAGWSPALRTLSVERTLDIGFEAYAIGGLSVGEPADIMYKVVGHTAPLLPADRPRYLMGVGTPADLVEAVSRGVDLFDCVMPTRNARNGQLFTSQGRLEHQERPVRRGCRAARSGLRLLHLPHVFPRVSAPPVRGRRDRRGCPQHGTQPPLLP